MGHRRGEDGSKTRAAVRSMTGAPPAGPFDKQRAKKMKATVRTIAITAALIATPAAAADLYARPPGPAYAAAPFNGYNWNGAYVGVNLGYQWGQVTNWGSAKPSGLMGGG